MHLTDIHQPTKPVPPQRLLDEIASLVQRNNELEQRYQTLERQNKALEKRLTDGSRLLKASTTSLISLDKSGLIDDLNRCAANLLGTDKAYLLRKPISLFIAQEDQALFYINRSRVAAGALPQPFELRLKRQDGAVLTTRVCVQPGESPDAKSAGILMAIEDITSHRQTLDALQRKTYLIDLLFSILTDLSVCSRPDIDEMAIYALEKLGLIASADRTYVCLFAEAQTRFAITHEWHGNHVQASAVGRTGAMTAPYFNIVAQLKTGRSIAVSDARKTQKGRSGGDGWQAPEATSFLVTPLFYGRTLMGVIGCDTVGRSAVWSRDTRLLVKSVGGAIVNALLRRHVERLPASVREPLLQFVDPAPPTERLAPLKIATTAKAAPRQGPAGPPNGIDWHFEEIESEEAGPLTTATLKDGKTATITCTQCTRKKRLDRSQIRAIGTRLKATCICGSVKYVRIELRREQRKTVNLEGIFINGTGDWSVMQPDDWGGIRIHDLSHHGVGIKRFDNADVRVGDRFRVKFTLDDTARSVIQKEVVVRSVVGNAIGCEFVGQDPCDVTIGFYLMT